MAIDKFSRHMGVGYTVALLVAALCLGGGTRPGFLGDVFLQLGAVPLLLWSLWRLLGDEDAAGGWGAVFLAAAFAVVPLLQLVPLPADVTSRFPVRAQEFEVWTAIQSTPDGISTSVSKSATALSLLSLLPAIALFLSVRFLTRAERRIVVFALIASGSISVLLGLLQLSQGRSSPFRFYQITNSDDAVGFFANRNHFAALLNCVLVYSIAWMLNIAATPRRVGEYGRWRTVALIASGAAVVTLLAGASMARSRAGAGTTILALLSGALLAVGMRGTASRLTPLRMLAVVVGAGVALGMQYALFRLLERFAIDPLQEARIVFARTTYEAISAYFPWGSGLGTFTRVHPLFESADRALMDTYVNRAHNDFIEYALESGICGLALVVAAALLLGGKLIAAWRSDTEGSNDFDVILQRSSGLVLILVAVHSAFDYPLRTSAMMAVMAIAAGLLMTRGSLRDAPSESAIRTAHASGHSPEEAQPPFRALAALPGSWPTAPLSDPARLSGATTRAGKAWGEEIAWPKEWQKQTKEPNSGSSSE